MSRRVGVKWVQGGSVGHGGVGAVEGECSKPLRGWECGAGEELQDQ